VAGWLCCSVLQCMLQYVAVYVVVCCSVLILMFILSAQTGGTATLWISAAHCNTLQQSTAQLRNILQHTDCNTLHHTATHCNTLIATHCNALQRTATHCNRPTLFILGVQKGGTTSLADCLFQHPSLCRNSGVFALQHTLQHTATHCNTLQHTATQCNTLQHTRLNPPITSAPVCSRVFVSACLWVNGVCLWGFMCVAACCSMLHRVAQGVCL